MSNTLAQARAFDALAKHRTYQAAAKALHKAHTAVLASVRALEEQTGLVLLDRRGYRTKLTPAGERVLEACRALLAAERALESVCHEIQSGWEPRLCIVFDGVQPAAPILAAVAELVRDGVPTKLDVRADFLDGVEATFERVEADLMIAVLPPRDARLRAIALPPIPASLVVHRAHPLGSTKRVSTAGELEQHVLCTVRGSDPRLVLSTSALVPRTTIHLNDFAAKHEAIAGGIGYGWLPDAMIEAELARGTLQRVRWEGPSTHVFEPRLYHRADAALGRAAARVVERLGVTAQRARSAKPR
jgi:DNA-binding transcriptional LysR family regulator